MSANEETPQYAYSQILEEDVQIFPPMRPEEDQDEEEECDNCGDTGASCFFDVYLCPVCKSQLGYDEDDDDHDSPHDELDDIDATGNYFDNDNDFDIHY